MAHTKNRKLMLSIGLVVVAMAPLAAAFVYKEFLHHRPYWVIHYDPEMAYYQSGLDVAQGKLPFHTDHPGTPVQYLAAVAIKTFGDGVLQVPQVLMWTRVMLLALVSASVALMLATLFRSIPWPLGLAGVWTYYISGQALRYFDLVTPEALYLPATALFATAIWRQVFKPPSRVALLVSGATLGVCVSLKFLFLAWVPALAVLAWLDTRTGRGITRLINTAIAVGGVCLGFLMVTMPIAGTYDKMFSWLINLLTHDGAYGSGDLAWPTFSDWLNALGSAVGSAKAWYLWSVALLTGCAFTIYAQRTGSDGRQTDQGPLRLLVFLSLAMILSHGLLVRGFAIRYLMPMAILGVLAFALLLRLHNVRKWRLRTWLPLAIVSVLLVKNGLHEIKIHDGIVVAGTEMSRTFDEIVRRDSGEDVHPVVVFSFRVPRQSYADRLFSKAPRQNVLDRVHPREGHYKPWSRELRLPGTATSWDYLVIREKDIADFPGPTGRVVETLGEYTVVAAR